MANNQLQNKFVALLLPVTVILILWEIIALINIESNKLFLATPQEILLAFVSLLKNLEFYQDIFYTLWRSLIAVFIATCLAIPAVLFISLHKSFFIISELSIDFFRSIPSTALFPLFLIAFGLNDIARIGTSVFVCFWLILFNLVYGIFHISKTKMDALLVMKASRVQIFQHLLFWETLVFLFSGIRIAISVSMIIIIITEMLVTPKFGLGSRIFFMQQTYKIPQMYALIIITGLVSFLINKLVANSEKN